MRDHVQSRVFNFVPIMASTLLALLDDIATLLDDVAVLSKAAAQKTTGVLGDDLALNAQQVSGIRAERELPVVWAVAKGSLRNKAILVPAALAISAFAPWAVTPLLMAGGAYLCFEGVEKLAHKFLHKAEDEAEHAQQVQALSDPSVDLVAFEQDKIKGAIRTDFILSAEIIVITLGLVAGSSLATQVLVLSGIAVLMTVGVYGLVGAIVKLDDLGLFLSRKAEPWKRSVGSVLLAAAPRLMKALAVVGTAAMFMVGGGILMHGMAPVHHAVEHLAQTLPAAPVLPWLAATLGDVLVGIGCGALVLAVVEGAAKLRKR